MVSSSLASQLRLAKKKGTSYQTILGCEWRSFQPPELEKILGFLNKITEVPSLEIFYRTSHHIMTMQPYGGGNRFG